MKQYKIEVEYRFKGHFIVNSNDKDEAREMVEKHCGCVLSGANPHTVLSDDIIPDWNFDVHPTTIIKSIKLT